MKTMFTRFALLLPLTLSLGYVSANGPATPLRAASPTQLERELDRQINKFVTYPLFTRGHSMNGEVVVSFVINTEGKVNVISAHSVNTELCEYVLRMLDRIDIGDNPDGVWKTTHVKFKFRPEA